MLCCLTSRAQSLEGLAEYKADLAVGAPRLILKLNPLSVVTRTLNIALEQPINNRFSLQYGLLSTWVAAGVQLPTTGIALSIEGRLYFQPMAARRRSFLALSLRYYDLTVPMRILGDECSSSGGGWFSFVSCSRTKLEGYQVIRSQSIGLNFLMGAQHRLGSRWRADYWFGPGYSFDVGARYTNYRPNTILEAPQGSAGGATWYRGFSIRAGASIGLVL